MSPVVTQEEAEKKYPRVEVETDGAWQHTRVKLWMDAETGIDVTNICTAVKTAGRSPMVSVTLLGVNYDTILDEFDISVPPPPSVA